MPGAQLLIFDESVADCFRRIEVADQLVDHQLSVRGVEPITALTICDHRESVRHVGIWNHPPAGRKWQHEVQRDEVGRLLRLKRYALLLEELQHGSGGGGREGSGSRCCGDWFGSLRCGGRFGSLRCGDWFGRLRCGGRCRGRLGCDGDRLGHRGCRCRCRRRGWCRGHRLGGGAGAGESDNGHRPGGDAAYQYPPLTGDPVHCKHPLRAIVAPDGWARAPTARNCPAVLVDCKHRGLSITGPESTWNQPLTCMQRNRYRAVVSRTTTDTLSA